MNGFLSKAFCENPKSAIQNLKFVGIVALGVTFAMCGAVAQAQQPQKVPRIGILVGGSASSDSARIEALRQGLRELGYVEGKNIVIEYRYAEGKLDRPSPIGAGLGRM